MEYPSSSSASEKEEEESDKSREAELFGDIRWKKRLKWLGHVTRMGNDRLPSMALHGYVEGTRSRGRQQKTWMDNIREDLERMKMNIAEAKEQIKDREFWRRQVEDSSLALA